MRSIVEIHLDGQWVPAAEFEPRNAPYTASFEYLPEYVFGTSPQPLSLILPVNTAPLGFDGEGFSPCPSFLMDLVPQGRGRKFLVHQLGVKDQGEATDLLLAQFGAFNPVGNLRLNTAVKFYDDYRVQFPDVKAEHFELDDIRGRSESFLEHIWLHSMLSAGTTGVQGAAPKFMLARDKEGLWCADAALPDENAESHWLVKLPRGRDATDLQVLRNEAAYLRVADRCGLRVAGSPDLVDNMLFIPRFDRMVDGKGVHRLHQETLASLAGLLGFGMTESQFRLVNAFSKHVTHPAEEVAEFIRRDILNQALKNPDNHARNTSVQVLPDGTVQLTPVYDFAPMYLDQDGIVRGCRWKLQNQPEVTDWNEVIELLDIDEADKPEIVSAVRDFASTVADLPTIMRDCDVDSKVIEDCRHSIDIQAARLDQVRGYGQTP
jgi:serine/threonine-protein kinase HipA